MHLPEGFLMQMKTTFEDESEFQTFCDAVNSEPITSVRINKNKWQGNLSEQNQVPWCELGYYLDKRPIFTLDPIFHSGGYYVQEAASMYIWHVLHQLKYDNKDLKILDLSAAPGGKSTLIASWLGGKGLLLANEIVKNRAYTLKYNLMKEGYSNIIVTNNSPEDFQGLRNFFDVIIVDAPCSGEGMFRKDHDAVSHWSLENIDHCATRQKTILQQIEPALKPEGYLIYSTCTYNRQENIKNADFIVDNLKMDSIAIPNDINWGITVQKGNNSIGYQFYPHKTKGEGFFLSLFRKKDESRDAPIVKSRKANVYPTDKKETAVIKEWVKQSDHVFYKDKTGMVHAFPNQNLTSILDIDQCLRMIYCGVSLGIVNKNILIPDHSLALSHLVSENIPKWELDHTSALQYLKKNLQSISSSQKSWMLASYHGLHMGFLKNIGDRINNYLPNEYKILMDVS